MTKLVTIQKRENLNTVYRIGSVGPGDAYHYYAIFRSTASVDSEDSPAMEGITFQRGPRNDPDSVMGVLDVDLLEIVRDRLTCFQQGEFACRENAIALTHIEEALLWMNKRVEDR